MSLGRQVTREASIYLIGFVGAAMLQFLAVPVYTRLLGPDRYSAYALALAVTTSLTGLLLIGGDVALARFWFEAESGRSRRDLALTWISFLTAWSALVVILAIPLSRRLAEALRPGTDLGTLFTVGLLVLIPAQLSRMLAQVLRNEFRPTAFAVTTVLVGGMGIAFGLALAIGANLGVLGILAGTLLAEVIGCVVRFPLVRVNLRGRIRREALGPPLRFGIPFVPASVAMWVFTGADRIAVGRYLTNTELGGYSVAATLVAPFSVLLTAMGQAWIPRVTKEFSESAPRARSTTGRAIELSLVLYAMGATMLVVAAPKAVEIVAGPGYESGAEALPFLALGSTFLGTSLFTSTGYTLAKRTSMVPVIFGAAAVLDIACLVLLVPRWGVVGASVATCVGYLALTVGSMLYSQRYFRVPVSVPLVGLVTASTTAAAVAASVAPGDPSSSAVAAAAIAIQLLTAYRLIGRLSLGQAWMRRNRS